MIVGCFSGKEERPAMPFLPDPENRLLKSADYRK